jgi:tRNA-dihydrouridine synthase
MSIAFKGERRAVLEHRKRYAGYLKGYAGAAKLRAQLMEFLEYPPIETLLRRYEEEMLRSGRAASPAPDA